MKMFYINAQSESFVRLRALAECLGISTDLCEIHDSAGFVAAMEHAVSAGEAGFVLDVGSLAKICREDDLERIDLYSCRVSLLLLATEFNERSDRFLRILTRGAVLGCRDAGVAAHVNFPKEVMNWAKELSSRSYPREPTHAVGLTVDLEANADTIMTLDQCPSFVRVRLGKASVFIWSTWEVFSVSRPLTAEREFEDVSDTYVPAIIFLRSVFGDQCWHNPNAGAGIILDDPLLKKRYGFINFPQLLGSARKHGYHVTLAFIPWNYWRSRTKKAKMFLEHSDCFGLCVHGCDHTADEFKTDDYEALLHKSFLARQRMERHGQRTGLTSEPLLVCPQEQYSLQAMRACSDSRQFMGMICTACMPRDLPSPTICGADLLFPAQDSFFGFPIFKRHYWNGMNAFAMALFLGKPAILAEHHEFFRNGSAGVEEFARRLSELRPDLIWTSLMKTVTGTHMRRRVSGGRWEVRFFTDTLRFEHAFDLPTEYRFLRRIGQATVVKRVLVNGGDVPFTKKDSFLIFEVSAHHRQNLSIEVEVASIKPTEVHSSGIRYETSVAFRRGLSEFRDNVLARNRFALGLSRFLVKSLRQANRRRKTDVRGLKTEGGGRKAERQIRDQRSEIGSSVKS